jgi:hypothetical protein
VGQVGQDWDKLGQLSRGKTAGKWDRTGHTPLGVSRLSHPDAAMFDLVGWWAYNPPNPTSQASPLELTVSARVGRYGVEPWHFLLVCVKMTKP